MIVIHDAAYLARVLRRPSKRIAALYLAAALALLTEAQWPTR